MIELPGDGARFLHELRGPPDAATVMLLHGLGATAELCWRSSFDQLGAHFRVLAPDLRGHGRGARSPFSSLEDCADDVVALAEWAGITRLIVAGYSLGGLVAQLIWHRHPELVSGLVLCATADEFVGPALARAMALAVPSFALVSHLVPPMLRVDAGMLGSALYGTPTDVTAREWMAGELRRTDLATVMDAALAAASFSSRDWLSGIDVPAAVLVTTRDSLVAPRSQLRLAESIPGAAVHRVAAGHGACVSHPDLFVPALVEACCTVARRSSTA